MSDEPYQEGSSVIWVPRETDLASWAKILMYDTYQQRDRQRCSTDDFASGFIGALVALRWRSAFLPEVRWPFPPRTYPLPGVVEAFVLAGPNTVPDLPDALLGVHMRADEARGKGIEGDPYHLTRAVDPPLAGDLTAADILSREQRGADALRSDE